MHSEHRLWAQEISLWRDDLRVWQQELAQAQKELQDIEAALGAHGTELRKHAASLRLEETTIDSHEHEIAAYENQGEGNALVGMARTHTQEGSDHARHRQLHEELKRRHHAVIAHVNLLRKAIAELPPSSPGPAPTSPQRQIVEG
jgi:septal ring factor EnvC (AmiA/AmiB activator)